MDDDYYQADGASDNLVNNIPINNNAPQNPVQNTQPAQTGEETPNATTNTVATEQENSLAKATPVEPFVTPWDPPKSEDPAPQSTSLGGQTPSGDFGAPEPSTQTPPAMNNQITSEPEEPITAPIAGSMPDTASNAPVDEEDLRLKSFEASLAQEIQRNGEAVSQENIAEKVFMARANGTISAKIENFQELNDEQLRKAYELWDWHKAGEILSKVGQDNSVL